MLFLRTKQANSCPITGPIGNLLDEQSQRLNQPNSLQSLRMQFWYPFCRSERDRLQQKAMLDYEWNLIRSGCQKAETECENDYMINRTDYAFVSVHVTFISRLLSFLISSFLFLDSRRCRSWIRPIHRTKTNGSHCVHGCRGQSSRLLTPLCMSIYIPSPSRACRAISSRKEKKMIVPFCLLLSHFWLSNPSSWVRQFQRLESIREWLNCFHMWEFSSFKPCWQGLTWQ
jgi:hypothetical protein